MFDLGMQELIIIFIVALLVFGPKRLPELGKTLGKGLTEMKIALRGVKNSIEETENHIEQNNISKGTQEENKEKAETNKDG